MKQLLEWIDTEIATHTSQYDGEGYEEGVVFGMEVVREEVKALIDSIDVDAAAQALFLAGLPRGRSGELIPGHTTWNDLGPKAKERLRDMAKAALDTILKGDRHVST